MKKKRLCVFTLFVLFLILFLHTVYAEQHMKLLAVEESADEAKGTIADLGLRTVKGHGEVYTATFPLTEMDTQISTRVAKDIACEFAAKRCNDVDFLYTIKSNSSIIGGPSGGAALSVLTAAELKGKKIDDKISITGTINSGGLIGPVGGLIQKIKAASLEGLNTVLIPKGTRYVDIINRSNITKTVDLVEYGKDVNITVIEVSTLSEAYSYFTHTKYEEPIINLKVDESYKTTMKMLADMLCNRTNELKTVLDWNDTKEVKNLSAKAKLNYDLGNYYTAASYCFGENLVYQKERYSELSYFELQEKTEKMHKRILNFKTMDYDSITDLQIYMVVKERLYEAERWVYLANQSLEKKNLKDAAQQTAYANERIYSAEVWSNFFNNNDEKVMFSQEMLKQGCVTKIEEAKERIQYVKLYFPELVKDTQMELAQAESDLENSQYELCMFKSAKAKADADVILGIMGVKKEYLDSTIDEKLKVVLKEIAKKTYFPIVPYSYYEYAQDLKSEDKYSSLLYAEYALELANLEMYYKIDGQKVELNGREKLIVLILVILLLLISQYHIRRY